MNYRVTAKTFTTLAYIDYEEFLFTLNKFPSDKEAFFQMKN